MNLDGSATADLFDKDDPDRASKLKDVLNSCDAFLVETIN